MLKQFHKNKVFSRLMLVATMIGLTGFAALAADTPAARTPETAKVIPGEFTDAKAMYLIFGNYNPLTEESETTITNKQAKECYFLDKPLKGSPEAETAESGREAVEPDGSFPVFASTHFSRRFFDQSGERQVILFSLLVDDELRTRSPILAGALFSKVNDGWRLDAFNGFIRQMGDFRKLPPMKLSKIGENRYGVVILDTTGGSGGESTCFYVIGEAQGKLAMLFEETEFNGAYCSSDIPGPKKLVYEFSSRYSFQNKRRADWYDLKIVTKGTRALESNPQDDDSKPSKIVSANQTKRFAFKDGQYRPVE